MLTSTLTALEGEFGIDQSVVSLPLNPGGTTSVIFQADRVALEPDETFALELALLNMANVNRALFESSLPNVFFRSRQQFIIQDSTGKLDFIGRDVLIIILIAGIFLTILTIHRYRFSSERE